MKAVTLYERVKERWWRMRKYKTVIEVVCEAENSNQALDIAGEYLRGALNSGVTMKCQTGPAYNGTRILITAFFLVGLIGVGLLFAGSPQPSQGEMADLVSLNACQAPLKTNMSDKAKADFKARWQDCQRAQGLARITQ